MCIAYIHAAVLLEEVDLQMQSSAGIFNQIGSVSVQRYSYLRESSGSLPQVSESHDPVHSRNGAPSNPHNNSLYSTK